MLKIVNGAGLVLELPQDYVISGDRICSLFNDSDSFFSDINYPGTAPFTEPNKKFFDLAHLVETSNRWYRFAVTWYSEVLTVGAGYIRFRVGPSGYEFNLELNYAAINPLIKNILLTEILTKDALLTKTLATLPALMLDTVQNPDKYPYIFFPVYNPGMGTTHGSGYQFVNYFHAPTQSFVVTNPADGGVVGNTPFFKLSYILTQIFEYLGLTAAGSFLTDAKTKHICIYSRICLVNSLILPSMGYMPSMLISAFLKQLRDRLHLVIDIDLASGSATCETFASICRSTDLFDLTPFITTISEQEVPESTGSTVTLVSDEQDDAFKITSDGEDSHPPLYRLKSGDGSTVIELDCSTTKVVDLGTPELGIIGSKYAAVDQRVAGVLTGDDFWPADILTDRSEPATTNKWPLRLIRYTGYKTLTGGQHFPCSEPVDMDEDDILYYRFLNDGKVIVIQADLPAQVFAGLKMTRKYCFRSPGRNYMEAIIEKIEYDAHVDVNTISARITVRTINFDINTKVVIQPVENIVAGDIFGAMVKAYFDDSIRGMDEVNIEVQYSDSPIISLRPIVIPTNVKGTGGQSVPLLMGERSFRMIIRAGNPKYVQFLGTNAPFTWSAAGHYWYVDLNPIIRGALGYIKTYWVVF